MYFVTSIHYNTESDKVVAHCWGLFPEQAIAEGIIYRDRGDMYEMFYPYLVIEFIEDDVLEPPIREVAWYSFSEEKMEWQTCERPQSLEHINGFSIAR